MKLLDCVYIEKKGYVVRWVDKSGNIQSKPAYMYK